MEAAYQSLADTIFLRSQQCPHGRFLAAVAGAPGSGKTTIAAEVVRLLNENYTSFRSRPSRGETADFPFAMSVSMDGFHYPRSVLDSLPNKEEAYQRRGAPWTFDVESMVSFTRQLRIWADRSTLSSTGARTREEVEENPILAPSFDHALKDPVEGGVVILPSTSIIILEGNYLLLDRAQWREIPTLMDLRVYINVDPQLARNRVARRHVAVGISKNLEDAYERVDSNDSLNGDLVREKLCGGVDFVVQSMERGRALSARPVRYSVCAHDLKSVNRTPPSLH